MAYKFSRGNRGLGDIVFEDDVDTGIDFESDTVKIETGGAERLVVTNNGVGIGNNNPATLLHLEGTEPTITFSDSSTEKGTIGINSSDNILIENKTINKHIVFKVNDQGVVKEGLRLDGAVPEVVVNQTSDSLVDFRVESDNNTHMLFVDGSQDKIGIGLSNPSHMLDINGDIRIRGNDIRDNSANKAISFDGSANTEIVNSLIVGGGVYKKVRDVGSTGNILQTDYMIRGIQNNSIVLTLPSKTDNSGQILIIKDMLGNAGSPNNKTITINAASNETIDGTSN